MKDIETIKQTFSGDIIVDGDALYDEAATTLMRKGNPAVIFCPKNNEDVIAAIAYAKSNGLVLSVRSGGHSGAGHSTNDDGVVIDLSHFKDIEVIDEQEHLVRIGGGAKWGDIAKTLGEHNLAISSGDTKSVGVGGLTLGGGIGWMVRKYGLALDNLVAADIVTADGKTLHLSKTDNPELFWAIRGGSGNFGVVTHFEFRAHPIKNVVAGTITYKLDDTNKLIKGWRDVMRQAPEELTTMFLIMPSFGGNPAAAVIMACYAGDDEAVAMQAIEPLTKLGDAIGKDIKQKEYAEVLEEAHPPQGMKIIVHDTFIKDFSDEVIEAIAGQEGLVLQLRYLGGAMNRVSADATAFAHRENEVLVVSPTFVGPSATDEEIDKALEPWNKIEAFGNGSYCNFLSDASEKSITASYPEATYDRLVQLKKQYDPANIFNQTYNIKPIE